MLSALSGSLEWHAANFAKKNWTAAMSAKIHHVERTAHQRRELVKCSLVATYRWVRTK